MVPTNDNSLTESRLSPLGLLAFASLRAEEEQPWLGDCFVSPLYFELMAGDRSTIIFGESGGGKSALGLALRGRCYDAHRHPTRLLVEWDPTLPDWEGDTASDLVRSQVRYIFDACAVSLMHHWSALPEAFFSAPSWARDTAIWFVRTYGLEDIRIRMAHLGEDETATSVPNVVFETEYPQVLGLNAAPPRVARKLTQALNRMGLAGVWIIADVPDAMTETEQEQLRAGLATLLSTLPLFERAQFTYKIMASSHIESSLAKSAAIARNRMDGYKLEWNAQSLRRMVDLRLACATGQPDFMLDDLCASPRLVEWLENVGGASPRAWLEQVRPLFSHYLHDHLNSPIDTATWEALRRQHPPRLYLDETRRQVIVGGRRVPLEGIPDKGYDMLAYLYRNGGRVVSKAELYFLVYLGMDHVPRSPSDPGYEPPKQYEGVIDTNLWRLRKAIEPDQDAPVLIRTIRGRGVKLEIRW